MHKRTGWSFALIALIVGGCLYFIYSTRFLLGIDLRGGTELSYKLDLSKVADDVASVAEQVKTTIANRLDIHGLKEISIAVQGGDRLVVQVPGAKDSQDVDQIRRQIEQAGRMMFHLVATNDEQTEDRIKEIQEEERRYEQDLRAWVARKKEHDERFRAQGQEPPAFQEERPAEPLFIARAEVVAEELPGGRLKLNEIPNSRTGQRLTVLQNAPDYKVDGKHLSTATATYDKVGRPAVAFAFKPEGAQQFANLTGPNKGRHLAIVIDEHIRQQAEIKDRIYDRGELTGRFTRQEVTGIVTMLRGGALDTKPTLISQSTVGAVLGSDSIKKGTMAMVAGLLAILLFMAVYYMIGGMVANLALVLNILIILAFVVVFRQTLTFPGIAGILLTIAMAVDANILIFERVREELARGKSLLHALGTGYQRAFWVIFDSNITTILTGVVLFQIGSGPVKGFAVTLIAGLTASFFTSVFVTRVILSFLYNIGFLKNSFPMLKVFAPPRVDYVAIQRYCAGASVVVIVLTWAIFVLPRGMNNYGIDFTGGERITMNLARKIDIEELRRMVDSLPPSEKRLFKDYSPQTQDADPRGLARSFIILTRTEEEMGLASAQESAPEKANEEPAEEPAEKAAAGKPAAGKPEEKAPEPPPAGSPAPPAAPPGAPEGAPAAPAKVEAATTAPAAPLDETPHATGREAVLRRMLGKANLLLPDAFSEPRWVEEGTGQKLVLDVNLISVEPSFNAENLSINETLQRKLNEYFERHKEPRISGKPEDPRWPGLRLEKVENLSAPVPGNAGGDRVEIYQYRLTSVPYQPPPPGADDSTRNTPTHQEAVSEIKEWFRNEARDLKLAEPFPEVLAVGPRVARDLQTSAIIAVFISMVGIMFYMALRFELMYGIAGIVALVHDVVITIGLMAMTDYFLERTVPVKINLPEIAAFLTIIGFSINDTIVVFDRVREMLRAGRQKLSYREVVNAAVNQTLSRTIWTSLTTLFVTVALLLFGGEPIRGFSFAFAIGVVTGCYSTVFIASTVVVHLHDRQVQRRKALLAEAAR